MPDFIESAATFSPCGGYRYTLKRRWNADRPSCTFFMLNPSTADAEVSDPTITRCLGFAEREGCGSLLVLNLFALRSPNPRDVRVRGADAIGPENNAYINAELARADGLLIAAWGRFPWATARAQAVRAIIGARPLVCFGVNGDGSPKHPLYQARDAELQILP